MSPDIWTQCAPEFNFRSYEGTPWRVVEAQHLVATRKLVDSEEEQQILEELIEEAKPPVPSLVPHDENCTSYHYLLWTPFRYPPLRHGSRLGSPDRRGLWYGSETIETAFAEKAYYTFLFRSGSEADFGVFETSITAFCAYVSTKACANLTKPPFSRFQSELSSPTSYSTSQKVGAELVDRGTEVISFKSARCPEGGLNYGVAVISVFRERKPREFSSWFCVSSADTVEFKPVGFQISARRTVFHKSEFEVKRRIPSPQV